MTYRSFTTPDILLDKLMERYKIPEDYNMGPGKEQAWKLKKIIIKPRVIQVLQKWIGGFFNLDFSLDMIIRLTNFVDDISTSNPKVSVALKKVLSNAIHENITTEQKTFINPDKLQYPIVPKNIFSPTLNITDLDDLEIARQLTLMEFEVYSKIRPVELLNCAWSNPKLKHRAVNILRCTKRFNQISNWISNMIVTPETLKARKINYLKALNITRHLLRMNNYNSLLAVASGLQSAAVHRLKFTTDGADSKLIADYNAALDVMSSDKSYRNFRAKVKQLEPPTIPYIGIYLTDLTFIEDGNPNYIEHRQRKLINWAKRRMVFNVIQQLQVFQNKGYDLMPVKQIQDVLEKALSVEFLADNDLFNLSLKREPRGIQSVKELIE